MPHRLTVSILLLVTLAFLTLGSLAGEDTGKSQIEALLLRYAESLDRQDAGLAEQLLHAESRHFAITPNGLMAIGLREYLDQLEQKKIGGVPSNHSARQIEIAGLQRRRF